MGICQARTLEWVAMPSSRGLPNPGIKPRSPAMQVDSLPSELPRKPKNTGMGSLSILQGNFPTQESNWGHLHCNVLFTSELAEKVSTKELLELMNEFSKIAGY